MSNFAINDAGDVLEFDGQQWKPARMAANEKGEKVFFDGSAWKPVAATVGAGKGRGDARNTSDATAQAFGQGAAMGFGDELTAGVRAAAPGFANWMMSGPALQRDESIGGSPAPQTVSTAPTMQGRYDEELARERAKGQQFKKDSPVLATGANIGGSIAGAAGLAMAPGVGALMSGAGGVPMRMLKGATAGGVLGGVQGFGEGEGGVENRISGAGTGTAVGVGLGAALPAVGEVVKRGYQAVAPWALGKIADSAERFVQKATPRSLSAAAPEGGVPGFGENMAVRDSLATRLADSARIGAENIEGDAVTQRLARLLAKDRVSPATARGRLSELGDSAFISDLGRNTQRAARDAYVLEGEGQTIIERAFNARNEGAPRRMISAFEGGHPYPDIKEARSNIAQYVTDEGRRLYDPVLRGDARLNVSPDMAEQQNIALVRNAYTTMRRLFAEAGETPTEAELAHAVKQGLATNAEAARVGGRPVAPHLVSGVDANWRRALHDANPAIQAADNTYGPIAALPERLTQGQNFLKTGISDVAADFSPSALSREIPGMTPMERDVLGVGAVNAARDIAAQGPRQTRALAEKIATSDPDIGIAGRIPYILPRQSNEILRNARAEGVFARTDRAVRGGAADRAGDIQAAFSGLGSVPTDARGVLARALDQAQKIWAAMKEPNESSRAQLARLLTGTREENAQTLSLVEAMLQRQAAARSYSSGIAGGAGGYAADR